MPRKRNLSPYAQVAGQPLGGHPVGSVSCEQEIHCHTLLHEAVENPDYVLHALHGAKIRDMHDDFPAVRAHRLLEGFVFAAAEARRVDEIGNDFDRRIDLKMLLRFAAEVFGDRRYAVGMVDRMIHHRRKARILSYQRNVRAVQRSEYRNVQPLLAQDFPGQYGACGMRE